jgi:hypothetical protein
MESSLRRRLDIALLLLCLVAASSMLIAVELAGVPVLVMAAIGVVGFVFVPLFVLSTPDWAEGSAGDEPSN